MVYIHNHTKEDHLPDPIVAQKGGKRQLSGADTLKASSPVFHNMPPGLMNPAPKQVCARLFQAPVRAEASTCTGLVGRPVGARDTRRT